MKKNIEIDQWEKAFLDELSSQLEKYGFRFNKKKRTFLRETFHYLEFYYIRYGKYGRPKILIEMFVLDKSFLGDLHPPASYSEWENLVHDCAILRTTESFYAGKLCCQGYVECPSYWQHVDPIRYTSVFLEAILNKSNAIAKELGFEFPHAIQLHGKIECKENPEREVVEFAKSIDPHISSREWFWLEYMIGDCNLVLPNEWELVPRYERQMYRHELSSEYLIRNYDQIDDDGKYPDSFGKMFVVFAVKGSRVLLLTDREDAPVVTLYLTWSQSKENEKRADVKHYLTLFPNESLLE
jgi:hypothetical protein